MDIQPQSQQPISDDQELAKVLAGISANADQTGDLAEGLEEEATAATSSKKQPAAADDTDDAAQVPPAPLVPPLPVAPAPATDQALDAGGELESVKRDALNELRPLVDKLNVSPEEKFDTYLLLIRSTDDASLITPAHDAAKAIADEARRAQALLDVIKEIDYLSGPKQQA